VRVALISKVLLVMAFAALVGIGTFRKTGVCILSTINVKICQLCIINQI